ncbi:MAG: cyclic pyranopterin monophosphate synthase MoaC [Lachnospiraceae bacterium]|nr:cyclic pyranopterin monophosphate synthase MoaC [Lachnospiraceae bacterium]
MSRLTHTDENGSARMVDVGEKPVSRRTAQAEGSVFLNPETFALVKGNGTKKGNVLETAKLAGIMGAKKTGDLIPLAHPILLDHIDVTLTPDEETCCIRIRADVTSTGKTGVEMEAMTAVSVAALTVYDMCKAVQRDVVIGEIRLLKKTGGVHGDYEFSVDR